MGMVDYKLVQAIGSNELVVVFSAINFPRGKYGFFKFFSESGKNTLYINSPGNQWYQDGIDDILFLIDRVKLDLVVNKIFYYGASMGAYGALLFAILRKDGACLSFGPNVKLGLYESHSSRYEIEFDRRYSDLTKICSASDFPITVFFGAFDVVDAYYFFIQNTRCRVLIWSC